MQGFSPRAIWHPKTGDATVYLLSFLSKTLGYASFLNIFRRAASGIPTTLSKHETQLGQHDSEDVDMGGLGRQGRRALYLKSVLAQTLKELHGKISIKRTTKECWSFAAVLMDLWRWMNTEIAALWMETKVCRFSMYEMNVKDIRGPQKMYLMQVWMIRFQPEFDPTDSSDCDGRDLWCKFFCLSPPSATCPTT